MMKRKRLNNLIKYRISSYQSVLELWDILETDLIYLAGLYPEFELHAEIGCEDVDYYYFNNLNIVMQNQMSDYNFKTEFLKNWDITFEIELAYKKDTEYLTQFTTASDLNFKILDESKTIRIFLDSLFLGDIEHIKDFKKEFILGLVGETQECLTIKRLKIKDKHLILLDTMIEEILTLMEINGCDYAEAQHEILFFRKESFNNWTFEKIESLRLELDEIYDCIKM
jgi:hypothetical protein